VPILAEELEMPERRANSDECNAAESGKGSDNQ